MTINVERDYELVTIESVESEGNDEHLVYFDNSYDYYIQRSFENGKIIVSSKLGESWRKHCSQENKEKVESILHYPEWEADEYDLRKAALGRFLFAENLFYICAEIGYNNLES